MGAAFGTESLEYQHQLNLLLRYVPSPYLKKTKAGYTIIENTARTRHGLIAQEEDLLDDFAKIRAGQKKLGTVANRKKEYYKRLGASDISPEQLKKLARLRFDISSENEFQYSDIFDNLNDEQQQDVIDLMRSQSGLKQEMREDRYWQAVELYDKYLEENKKKRLQEQEQSEKGGGEPASLSKAEKNRLKRKIRK